MINHGISIRSTSATGVHDASSRSHAILRIYIQRNDFPKEKWENTGSQSNYTFSPEGVLTLVDLAGSEHRIDSMYHGKDRRKECSSINASLMALKDCIRGRAAGKNVSHQYRKSKLTMALKSSFSLPSARTMVIATVSPASKDTEHSLNTLRHASIMGEGTANKQTDERFVSGGRTTVMQVG
jgi:kinesin family protein 2/24